MPYVSRTFIQAIGESDADFQLQIDTFISDEAYYYAQSQSPRPPVPESEGDRFRGLPPNEPDEDYGFYDTTAGQFRRVVTFNYNNDYFFIFSGIVPPLPPPSPLPTDGEIAMFATGGTLVGTGMIVDTSGATVDVNAYQIKNALDAVDPQDLVTLSQLSAAIGGTVNTVNGVPPTLGNIQLTVSNSGVSGTLQWSGLDLQIPQADTDTTGLLSDTDWDTFNNKQPAGNYITALTGDGTASGPGSAAFTLATVNLSPGTFGTATKSARLSVNGKGLVTGVMEQTITPDTADITGGQALTGNNDTNVTISLGGTPATSLLKAVSMTLGWTGQLAVSRGGTGVDTASANTVFAGPTAGGAVPPAFRALVAADIPDISSLYVLRDGTTPLTGNWGAGAFSITANSVIVGSSANVISGGAAASGTFTLQSTTNATKGFTYLGGSGVFSVDETNEFIGINSATPAAKFEINGTGSAGNADGIRQRQPNVAHGMTTNVPTDVYLVQSYASPSAGGAGLTGYSDSDSVGLQLSGVNGATSTTIPAVQIRGFKKSGTTVAAVAATEPVLSVINSSTTVITTLGDGSTFFGGSTSPSAWIHAAAGTTTQPPIKLTSGTNLTTAETGSIEYNGTNLFFTRTGTTREAVLVGNAGGAAPGTSPGLALITFYGTGGTVYLSTPQTWIDVVDSTGTLRKIPAY